MTGKIQKQPSTALQNFIQTTPLSFSSAVYWYKQFSHTLCYAIRSMNGFVHVYQSWVKTVHIEFEDYNINSIYS